MIVSSEGKIIAIDFDGTIVEHAYPKIGAEMLFAFATLKELQKKGHRLVLWTYREGEYLQQAVEYCAANGVEFYAVNENYPGETKEGNYSRKLMADIFIDDRNIGGFLGWDQIWQMLHPEGEDFYLHLQNEMAHNNYKLQKKRKRFFGF
ncbi:MAG: hydrolase [Bacteroidota bacterium]|nr:hydrolase [Bacteroidota bacterium]